MNPSQKSEVKNKRAGDVFISSGALGFSDAKGAMEYCRAHGITHLELASGLRCPAEQWPLVEAVADEMGLLLHNYFPAPDIPFVLNLAALDAENLQQSLKLARNAIAQSARIGAPFFSVHGGFSHALKPEDLGNPAALLKRKGPDLARRNAAMAVFETSVRELADFGANLGVKLLLENNVVAAGSFQPGDHHGLMLVQADDIVEFFNRMDHDNIGLLADVGHAKVSSHTLNFDLDAWLDAVLPYVGAFHLSDNDGKKDNNQGFDAAAWFMPVLKRASHLPCVIEVYNIDQNEIERLMGVLDDNI